ncbi:MAG TPA: MraY family glycosyltransferase, partial [Thermoanaerobaculia bacterium]|nr:MraY family glycosyltransferase [Thermoanaerobaculia bacterium]
MTRSFPIDAAIAGGAGFLASLALTPAVRALARSRGMVAKPKSDRWHTRPTAMLGGMAIAIAVLGSVLLLLPQTRENVIVMAASAALFVVGLADDFLHIKPYQKLIGQLLAAAAVVALGLILPWTASYVVNVLITLFWLVGITNAVNMLDNMDGLAVGVCAIAAAFLAMNFYAGDQLPQALMLIAFAGALVGFLVYNHHPASIFMGDCGSMFVGFFLAASVLAAGTGSGRSRSVAAVLAVPVLVLLVPIFDTTLVTLMRKLAGRPASQGGRDHTSHRLVALGLSEKHAVW